MNAQDISKEILNEIETDAVIAFAKDKFKFEAVKKYIMAVVYKHGVVEKGIDYNGRVNFALNLAWGATQGNGMPRTDEELGQNLRALTYATQLMESGFRELAELKKPEPEMEETVNKAE
jgi:hypothetical protein